MELLYGDKERVFTPVGSNCIKCESECGTSRQLDNHTIDVSLLVNGEYKVLTLCLHPHSSQRGENSHIKGSDPIDNNRVCLVKESKFDPLSKVEVIPNRRSNI